MDVLSFPQKVEYVRRLRRHSADGTVEWGRLSDFAFVVHMARFYVELASRDEDDVHPFVLRIFRTEGALVAEISSEDGVGRPDADREQAEELLQDLGWLYSNAKRQALGVDELVAEVFADLDDLDPPP